jgi:hypothetical protein
MYQIGRWALLLANASAKPNLISNLLSSIICALGGTRYDCCAVGFGVGVH